MICLMAAALSLDPMVADVTASFSLLTASFSLLISEAVSAAAFRISVISLVASFDRLTKVVIPTTTAVITLRISPKGLALIANPRLLNAMVAALVLPTRRFCATDKAAVLTLAPFRLRACFNKASLFSLLQKASSLS